MAEREQALRQLLHAEMLSQTATPATTQEGHESRLRALHTYYREFGGEARTEDLIEVLARGLEVHEALQLDPQDLLLRLWQWADKPQGSDPAKRLLPVLRFLLKRCAGTPSAMVPALWVQRAVFERELGDYAAALESHREGQRRIQALRGQLRPEMESWMLGHLPFIEAERFVIQLELGLLTEASQSLEAQAQAVEALGTPPPWTGLGVQLNRVRLDYFQGRFRSGLDSLQGPEVQGLLLKLEEQSPEDLPRMTALLDLWRAVCQAGGRSPVRDQARGTLERLLQENHLPDKDAAQARRHLAEILIDEEEFPAVLELLPRQVSESNSRTTLDVVKYRALRAKAARRAGWSGERLAPLLQDLEASYGDFLRIWRSCPRPPSGVGFLQYPARRSIVAELIELNLRVHSGAAGRQRALQALLQAQACGTLSVELGAGAGNLQRIRTELLGAGGGLLAVLAGPEASHLFALDDGSLEYRRLAGEQSLRRGLRDLLPFRPELDAAGGVSPEDQERQARASQTQGSRWFDEELGSRIRGWTQLSVTGAESFGMTAIEGLALDASGTRLGSLPLTHLPSIAWALARRSEALPQPEEPGSLVVLAAPRLPAELGLSPIELEQHHLRAWLAPLTTRSTRSYLGSQATTAALRKDSTAAADALLIYTHGGYHRTGERPSYLWLASQDEPAERLFAEDVEALFSLQERPAPGLVILAACGAQRGPLRLGEDGVQHLGGAFLRSGSRCVLLSASDLDQAATRELVRLLFEQLAEPEVSVAAAMAAARTALAKDPRFAHPYFYGQLTVSGLGHRPIGR